MGWRLSGRQPAGGRRFASPLLGRHGTPDGWQAVPARTDLRERRAAAGSSGGSGSGRRALSPRLLLPPAARRRHPQVLPMALRALPADQPAGRCHGGAHHWCVGGLPLSLPPLPPPAPVCSRRGRCTPQLCCVQACARVLLTRCLPAFPAARPADNLYLDMVGGVQRRWAAAGARGVGWAEPARPAAGRRRRSGVPSAARAARLRPAALGWARQHPGAVSRPAPPPRSHAVLRPPPAPRPPARP